MQQSDVIVNLTTIEQQGDTISATFEVSGKLNEKVHYDAEEKYVDYVEWADNHYNHLHKYAWVSDKSFDVVDAYLFDYEYMYEAIFEVFDDAVGDTGYFNNAETGDYIITADFSEDFVGTGLVPLGKDKYDGSDVEWIPENIKVDNIKIKRI